MEKQQKTVLDSSKARGENGHRLLCIVCPKGCHLEVAEGGGGLEVKGAGCAKGVEYAKSELISPTRVLTTTVVLAGGEMARLPVKTAAPIPKGRLMEAMAALNEITVSAPVCCGDIIIPDLLKTGVSVVATACREAAR